VNDQERERDADAKEAALDDDLELTEEGSEDVKGGAPVRSNIVKTSEQVTQGTIGNIRG
jgi:hypothetical protein